MRNPLSALLRLASRLSRGSGLPAVAVAVVLLAVACANPGSGPDGGPYDETPPRVVAVSPALGHTHTTGRKVTLVFSELVQLDNPSEKIIVSPPQMEAPEIKTSGRRITVELTDSLKPATTYTIDFSDAIEDVTEGNPLGLFTYYFSTGAQVDTMEVGGHVLDAGNLEPVQGILVGLHADLADSAFRCRPLERVARTDASGYFSIKGVAPGTYRVYALKDMDGDFRFSQKSEMIAFSHDLVSPSCYPDVRYDTLWLDTVRYAAIREVPYTHYKPDDLVLLAFTEASQPRHLLKSVRDVPENFTLYFTAPADSAPRITGLGFDAREALAESASRGFDTITYWLRDTTLLPRDTLAFALTYMETDDSTGLPRERTDTLELVPRQTYARRLKQKAEELERWQKQLERRHRRGDYSDEEPPRDFLKITARVSGTMAPDRNVRFSLAEPAARLDTAAFHLLLGPDSAQTEAPFLLSRGPGLCDYTLYGEWRPGQHYTLQIDSAAICGYYGHENRLFTQKFSIAADDAFATLFVHLPGADTATVVQLLVSDKKVARQVRLRQGRADFYYIEPGTYYLRAFTDRNGNGLWDSGDYDADLAPEPVAYFHKKLELRANWDMEETWVLDELPLTAQKPEELSKQQKQTRKETARSRNLERERARGR